ncbi:hypothetical protein GQ457_14G012820 [Hibiscus cannabinus]
MIPFRLQSPQPPKISRLTQTSSSSSSTRAQGIRGSNKTIPLKKSMLCGYRWKICSPNNAHNIVHNEGKWEVTCQKAADKLEYVSNNSNVKLFRIDLQSSYQDVRELLHLNSSGTRTRSDLGEISWWLWRGKSLVDIDEYEVALKQDERAGWIREICYLDGIKT